MTRGGHRSVVVTSAGQQLVTRERKTVTIDFLPDAHCARSCTEAPAACPIPSHCEALRYGLRLPVSCSLLRTTLCDSQTFRSLGPLSLAIPVLVAVVRRLRRRDRRCARIRRQAALGLSASDSAGPARCPPRSPFPWSVAPVPVSSGGLRHAHCATRISSTLRCSIRAFDGSATSGSPTVADDAARHTRSHRVFW